MKLIERKSYLQKLIDVEGTPDIKVVTGVRRSGKSKLLEAFKHHVVSSDPDANIIHVNFNLTKFEGLMEYHALDEFVRAAYVPGASNYVIIDEVQMCEGFERAINSFHASENFDIYITGSNAFLLSSDLATLFTGRTFEIEVFPFSFAEYLAYFGEEEGIDGAFDRYVHTGGMSGSYPYKNEADRSAYVKDVFETLIMRDIRQKYDVRNPDLLNRLSEFLMDNVSNVTSARSVASSLEGDTEANHKTVGSYIEYLCNAYAFYKVRRYDIRGKKYLSSGDKYYLSDHSFRLAKLGTRNMDWGRVYENMVAIELLRRGYELYVGKLYQKEVDFVAMRGSEKMYVQVSDDISAFATFEREVDPLLRIRDGYPKFLIARTRHETYDHEGIMIHDLARRLSAE